MRLVENVQNGTKMGGAGMGIAADAAGGHSDTDREAGHSGTAARRHGRDKGKRGHDVVVPLPEAAVLAGLAEKHGGLGQASLHNRRTGARGHGQGSRCTAAQGHGRDKGKRGHDVVVPLPEAAVLAGLEGSGDTRRPRRGLST